MATDQNFRIKNGLTVGTVEVIDSSGKLTANAFGTNSNEKIEDVVADMITGSTHSNITVTYNDTNGTLAFSAAAQYGDSDVESYLDSGVSTPSFATISSGAISATSVGVTNIVTNKVVKFNGSILDDSNITDTGSAITLGSNTTVSGTISSGAITSSGAIDGTKISVDSGGSLGLRLHTNSGITASNNYMNFFTGQTSGWSFNANSTGADSSSVFTVDTSGNLSVSGTISSGAITSSGTLKSTNATGLILDTGAGYRDVQFVLTGNTGNGTLEIIPMTVPGSGTASYTTHFKNLVATGTTRHDLKVDGNATFGGTISSGAITATTVNTGQGANELYAMNQNVRTTDSPTFNQVTTTNNGSGTNYKVGDDAWIGDINVANTIRISGAQNANNGYISFGNSSNTALGRAGTGQLTWGSDEIYHEGHKPTYSELGTMAYSNLTGTPTIPSLSGYATESYVNTQVSNLVDSAPGSLDTLNELAAALGDDASFSTTVTNSIAAKLPLAGGVLTGNLSITVGNEAPAAANSSATGLLMRGNYNSNTWAHKFHKYDHSGGVPFYLSETIGTGSWAAVQRWGSYTGDSYKSRIFGTLKVDGVITANTGNSTNWNTAYGWGNHASAGYITDGNTNWNNTYGFITSSDSSITNKMPLAGGTFTGSLIQGYAAGTGEMFKWQNTTSGGHIQLGFQQNDTDGLHHRLYIKAYKGSGTAAGNVDLIVRGSGGSTTSDVLELHAGQRAAWQGNDIFTDAYHPNADTWTTARTITLGGDLSGNVSINGSANVTLTATVADDSHTHDGRYFTETESDSRYWRKNETGSGADFGPWYSTGPYIYDATNGTRYYWNLLGTIASSGCRGSIEYEAKDDENYPNFVKGTIAFSGFSGGTSFSVQHDQHTQDPHGVQVRLDTSRRIWIRTPGVDWASYFRFRVHNQSGNFTTNTSWSTGSTRYDTVTNATPPNSSSDILSGQNLRATSSSVTGTVPSYNNFNYFGRVYARDLMQVNGNLVWHAGNDGANSGLDADLLDGQEGSYYLNYNNLTNTPSASANYYLNGISKSGNTLTFSVNGATNQTYTFGSNAFNSTTIPTNNTQLTNGAGYITASNGAITNKLPLAGGNMTGELNITSNTGVTGSSAPSYTTAKLEVQTSSNHVPAIAFHRGGYSATALYEYDGELYTNAWISRAQNGKLLSSGNVGSYAASWKYAFASNDGTNNGGSVTASSAQDGIYFNGTNGITTSASGSTLTLSGANLLRSDTDDTTVGTLNVNKTNDGIGMTITRPASGNYGGTLVVGATNVGDTLVDGNRRPMVVIDGQYPVLNLNHTETSNSNHGPTIQFTHNGYNSNRQWVVGTDGTGNRLDFGVSGGTAGSNTDKNPHRGIAGYNGVTIARMFENGVLIGNTGVYPNEITSANAELDVRGSLYVEANTDETTYSGVHSHVIRTTGNSGGGNGAQLLVQNDRGNHSWGTVAEFRINTAGDSDNPSIIFTSAAEGTNTWGIGYGYTDTNFRINRDHGHLNSNWGVAMMTLDRSGNATFAGNVTAYSDERLKENIETIPDAIETVKKIRGVTFDWKETGEEGMGVIAQEIEEVPILKRLVNETPKDGVSEFAQKNVAYGNMVGLLIEAVKEQQEQIEELKSIINTLVESK